MEKKIMIKNKSQYTCNYGKVKRGKFMNSKAKTLINFKIFNNMLSKFEKINSQNKILEKLKIWKLDKGRKYEGFPGGASGKEPSCQCR